MRPPQPVSILCLALLSSHVLGLRAAVVASQENAYATWKNGPSTATDYFPIAVWLQNPSRAERYREAGFNTYVGLWHGPTEEQLSRLKTSGMKVICAQNEIGLRHRDDPTIIGWMHGDEPDNAQSLGPGKGYGPPVPPPRIVSDFLQMREKDPHRPILLNLGQGVAWDNWHGRGTRTRHPEDYPDYVRGGDIISFDIYPAVHAHSEVAGNLWFVAQGVRRLKAWTKGEKIVWNCIECTRIHNPDRKPTPHEVRAEVWMSLIHGSQGLIYFVHEWVPRFNEAALLDDSEMLTAVTALNRQIRLLAPVLNAPTMTEVLRIELEDPERPVAAVAKRYGEDVYLFTVNLRGTSTRCTFDLRAFSNSTEIIDIEDRSRSLTHEESRLSEHFDPWEVHLFRLRPNG
jgi:hypothetical protein